MRSLFVSLTFAAMAAVLIGCNRPANSERGSITRKTLENGTVLVQYSAFPETKVQTMDIDLKIGVMEGEPEYLFGNVKGVDVDSEGSIYVLESQTAEVRVYDANGVFLRTIATRGDGPGEISEANGMALVGDSIIWVHDHGRWRYSGIHPSGGEVATFEMPIRSYGWFWSGTIDNSGRFWKAHSYSDGGFQMPEDGWNTYAGDSYLIGFDPKTQRRDSLFLGHYERQTYVSVSGGGFRSYPTPFRGGTSRHIDPYDGYWSTGGTEYQISHVSSQGDTTLVITAPVEPDPVTDEDRDQFLARYADASLDELAVWQDVMSTAPDVKPLFSGLLFDDQDRLWVQRETADDELDRHDVFDREGNFLGYVNVAFSTDRSPALRIRNDRIYAVHIDSLGVPMVVRSTPVRLEGGQ